jgi:hypothetical protein
VRSRRRAISTYARAFKRNLKDPEFLSEVITGDDMGSEVSLRSKTTVS